MKRHIIYECEKCGKQSRKYDEIWECEANHLGLTSKEMIEYTDLKEKVRNCSCTVSIENNDETRAKQDKAIDELIEFEERHNLN